MRRVSAWQEVLVGVAVSVGVTGGPQAEAEQAAGAKEEFSKEVAAVLEKRIGVLRELTQDPIILQAVTASNAKNSAIPLTDILTVDRKWIAKDKSVDPFIKSLMTNACANRLMVFQDAHDGYPEVFIADAKGANVCLTNRTSDYYQAIGVLKAIVDITAIKREL